MEINEQLLKQFNLEVNYNYTYHSEMMDSIILRSLYRYLKKPFKQMTKEDIINYVQGLKTGESTKQGKPFKPYTIELYRCQIKKFFK